MNGKEDGHPDDRFRQILEMVIQVASGNLGERVTPSQAGDEIDSLMVGLNMLAEELTSIIEAERRIRETLEERVHERTGELQEKLDVIEKQRHAILDLSTPVIPIWDGILVLPLIGAIDTARAQQIVENLLESIVDTQASVAIIDITGVPLIDTPLAKDLLKTIEAAKMLGAQIIVTGASPISAENLVKLGIDLRSIVAKSSLQAGLKLALAMTKNKVVKQE